VSTVDNARKAIGARVECTPQDIERLLSPFVGQGNGTVKLTLTDGTYATS
jgi:hypothetical protein